MGTFINCIFNGKILLCTKFSQFKLILNGHENINVHHDDTDDTVLFIENRVSAKYKESFICLCSYHSM